ncbi:D-inositol-3-phosphate glycosyltransferase [subsurface metagenome]
MEEKSNEKKIKKSAYKLNNIAGKRCLMVVHRFWPFLGGSERHFLKWATVLDEKDCNVYVFTTNAWEDDFFHHKERKYIKESTASIGRNIKIRRFRIFHPPNRNAMFKFFSKFPGRTIKLLIGKPYIFVPGYYIYMFLISLFMPRKFNFVIAGVFPHYYLIYPALFYAMVKKIPFILAPLVPFGEPNSTENFNMYFNERANYILKKSDYILTNTNDEKEKLVSYGINQNKIKISGIGIDDKPDINGNGNKFKEKYNISTPYILQISAQSHGKGSHHTVEAMKLLWNKGVNVKLVLIGQILNDFESYLFLQKSYVFENTIILNYSSEEDKNNAIDGCEVFLMPSKLDSFGLVYLESWLHRKPVIAAYCSGVMEVIDEGINGFLVPFGDCEMIAGYILKLLNDKELAQNMGEEGYKKTKSNYLWEQRIKGFNKLIEGLKI